MDLSDFRTIFDNNFIVNFPSQVRVFVVFFPTLVDPAYNKTLYNTPRTISRYPLRRRRRFVYKIEKSIADPLPLSGPARGQATAGAHAHAHATSSAGEDGGGGGGSCIISDGEFRFYIILFYRGGGFHPAAPERRNIIVGTRRVNGLHTLTRARARTRKTCSGVRPSRGGGRPAVQLQPRGCVPLVTRSLARSLVARVRVIRWPTRTHGERWWCAIVGVRR